MFTLWLAIVSLARADDGVATVRMLPNTMFVPTLATQIGVTGTLDARYPVLIEAMIGLPGLPGVQSDSAWLTIDGAVSVDGLGVSHGSANALDPVAFTTRLTPWRRASQSQPIVAAQDVRIGAISLKRDRPLDVELSALVHVLDWSGGVFLPANHSGDLDARIVVGLRALGAQWVHSEARPLDFLGGSLGGLSGGLVYGRKWRKLTLTGHLGARADASIGVRDGFATRTETAVWLGAVLDLGRGYSLRLFGDSRSVRENGAPARSMPGATLAVRAIW